MRASTALLAGLLGAAGALHLAKPSVYERVVPGWVPGTPRQVVLVSGAAEAALGAALLPRRTRRLAAWGAVALFVAVFPANVKQFRRASRRPGAERWITAARLPLQLPLVWWAARVACRVD
ncbi:DoxX family protein [Arenivirga flava]|uniref:Methylamine utilisation protein MauE domain-containing protein n=1 Tax=Arenivirga flava TaxID=1930060 RepID=A0AA37UFQ3_9MICO|nr:DoxX family protein [Arenivirga flava]GMA29484.1 hypothetical protein GCM10025874_27370 [Arenivirga flava]